MKRELDSAHQHRRRQRGNSLTSLADVLTAQGRYPEARDAYQEGLKIAEDQKDLRGQGVSVCDLGTLALFEGNLEEALYRYQDSLTLFQQLREPASEATVWHQLGRTFELAQKWEEAEQHYREAARLHEGVGNLAKAAQTWNQLGSVNRAAGKSASAEAWYRKAIEGGRQAGDVFSTANTLSNLATLLRYQPSRLVEARQLAEEALAIKKTLDPGVSEVWTTFSTLAYIAHLEGKLAQAREYQRLAREARRNFAGTHHELRRRAPLILAILAACTGQEEARQTVLQHQKTMREAGEDWSRVANILDRILAGEREVESLCESLDLEGSMIVETILQGINDPPTLQNLLSAEEQRSHHLLEDEFLLISDRRPIT